MTNKCSTCELPLPQRPIKVEYHRDDQHHLPCFDVFCTWQCVLIFVREKAITGRAPWEREEHHAKR